MTDISADEPTVIEESAVTGRPSALDAPTVIDEPARPPVPTPSLRWLVDATRWHPLIAGVIASVIAWLFMHGRSTVYNNFVVLADAFNHGSIAINFPGEYFEALPWDGHFWVIEGPLPAVLLMPFVAVFGTGINQGYLTIVLVGVAVAAAWRICQRLGLKTVPTLALVSFMYAGTQLLWSAFIADVWYTAQVTAVTFTLLAVNELLGKRRGWLVALLAACAAEARFPMAIVIPVYLYLLLTEAAEPKRLSPQFKERLLGFVAVGAVFTVLWVAYNHVRWGSINDIAYTEWFHYDSYGSATGSPFQLKFLQHELYSYLIQGPEFHPGFPWVTPGKDGQAMLWTSPALLLIFLARRPKRWVIAMWVAAALAAIPNLLYYENGFSQFGMRHALDFEPFLFVLMALGVRARFPRWGYILIGISVAIGLWGCWYWDVYYL